MAERFTKSGRRRSFNKGAGLTSPNPYEEDEPEDEDKDGEPDYESWQK
jgi:hypothetical protein